MGASPPKLPSMLPRRQDNEKVRREVAVQEAKELPPADVRQESPGLRLPQAAGTDSGSKETGDGDAKAPRFRNYVTTLPAGQEPPKASKYLVVACRSRPHPLV